MVNPINRTQLPEFVTPSNLKFNQDKSLQSLVHRLFVTGSTRIGSHHITIEKESDDDIKILGQFLRVTKSSFSDSEKERSKEQKEKKKKKKSLVFLLSCIQTEAPSKKATLRITALPKKESTLLFEIKFAKRRAN